MRVRPGLIPTLLTHSSKITLDYAANSKAGAANGPLSPTQQLKPAVLRVVVLDDTYGCAQHVRDLTQADVGADADAPSEPKQLQVHRHLCAYPAASLLQSSSDCNPTESWDIVIAMGASYAGSILQVMLQHHHASYWIYIV